MAYLLVITVLLLLHRHKTHASPITYPDTYPDHHINGHCTQLTVPITATAESAIYDLPLINDDITAAAYAIHSDAWSTSPIAVLKNTTTCGTFNIHTQLCLPSSNSNNILQILTHGAHFDSRYWDPDFHPENTSYVEAALAAGYSTLTYDRLGAGNSDHPDAYTVVQTPLELEILHQLTLMVRNRTYFNLLSNSTPNPVFRSLPTPTKFVHIGNSLGSFITTAFIAKYPDLTNAAIITGYVPNKYLSRPGMVSMDTSHAASVPFPGPYNRSEGYTVASFHGIQNIFFGGNITSPEPAFTHETLAYANLIKQPVSIGELASTGTLLGVKGAETKAPVLFFLAEFDAAICGGDCKGVYDLDMLREEMFPVAEAVEVYVQPNSGHGLPLHRNATAGFEVELDFLGRYGV